MVSYNLGLHVTLNVQSFIIFGAIIVSNWIWRSCHTTVEYTGKTTCSQTNSWKSDKQFLVHKVPTEQKFQWHSGPSLVYQRIKEELNQKKTFTNNVPLITLSYIDTTFSECLLFLHHLPFSELFFSMPEYALKLQMLRSKTTSALDSVQF